MGSSFRSRMAFWSMLFSGIFLAIFCVAFLGITHRIGMERIDKEMQTVAANAVARKHGTPFWEQFGETFETLLQPIREENWTLCVSGLDGAVLWEAADWPEDLSSCAESFAESRKSVESESSQELVTPDIRQHLEVLALQPLDATNYKRMEEGIRDMHALGVGNRGIEDYVRRELRRIGLTPARDGGPGRNSRGSPPRGPDLASPIPTTFETVSAKGKAWRVAYAGNENVNLIVAVDLAHLESEQRKHRNQLLLAMPVALIVLALAGRSIAGRALRPVQVIADTVEHINASELDQRIPSISVYS